MKTFKANEELEKVLLQQGFIETTSKADKKSGKKSFKLIKQSRKEIFFNNNNIDIFNRYTKQGSFPQIEADDFKYVLLYFKLKTDDANDFFLSTNKFEINKAKERLQALKEEFVGLKEIGYQHLRREKVKRIIDTFNAIDLDKSEDSKRKKK